MDCNYFNRPGTNSACLHVVRLLIKMYIRATCPECVGCGSGPRKPKPYSRVPCDYYSELQTKITTTLTIHIYTKLQPNKTSSYVLRTKIQHSNPWILLQFVWVSRVTAQIYIDLQYNKESSNKNKLKTTFEPPIKFQCVWIFRVTAQIHNTLQQRKLGSYRKNWKQHLNHRSSFSMFEYLEL